MSDQGNNSAALALQKFKSKKYDECLTHLNELTTQLKQNKRVAFNKAVAEFYLSGLKNLDAFKKELMQITGQSWPSVNINDIKSPADAAMYYSYAVLLYHTRHYAQAYVILEKLFSLREQIPDSNLNYALVLLLLEVCLCRRMPDKVNHFGDQVLNMFQKKSFETTDMFKKIRFRANLMNRKVAPAQPMREVKSLEWLILRAHQLYINDDLQEALGTLSKSHEMSQAHINNPEADEFRAPIINNMAIIYFGMRKHHFSVKCMQEALKEHLKAWQGDKSVKFTISRDRPMYVFNLGVALLKAHRPEDAFECLVEAARHYPNNPRIWLRLAECCVIHYTKNNKQDPVVYKIGSGPHTKLVPGPINKEKYSISSESYAIPTLSLEFAALCLMNAVTLLPLLDPPADFDQYVFQAAPSAPMNYKQYSSLKCSVLLLYSFVCLRLSDPSSAFYYCNAFLTRPSSPLQKALAHLYAAEALIGLDKISEAIDHLNPTAIHDMATKMNSGAPDIIGVAVWLNGAVCHAMRGDLLIARNILLQINSPRALSLQLYLEMCAGNIDNCRTLLRKFKQVPMHV